MWHVSLDIRNTLLINYRDGFINKKERCLYLGCCAVQFLKVSLETSSQANFPFLLSLSPPSNSMRLSSQLVFLGRM